MPEDATTGFEARGYNPLAAQPYTPVAAPEVAPPMPSPLPSDSPPINGAVRRSGAVATIADGILRGIMQGRTMADARKLMQAKAKSDNLLASYNQDAQRLMDLTNAGVDPNSQEYKTAVQAVHGSWGAWMDYMGQHVEQPKAKGKGKRIEQDLKGMFTSGDPSMVSAAWYKVAQQAGPPVLSQVAALNTPEMQQWRKARQGAAESAGLSAEQQLREAKQALQYSQIIAKPEAQWTQPDRDFVGQYEELHGKASDELVRQRVALGRQILDNPNMTLTPAQQELLTGRYPSGQPKIGSFGDFMLAAYGPQPTPEQYAQGRKLWAESGAQMTVGTHVIQVPQPDGSVKAYVVQTTSTKEPGSTPSLPTQRQDQPGTTSDPGSGTPPGPPPAQAAAPPAPASSPAPTGVALLAKYGANPEDEPPLESFARNRQWAMPGPYVTKLDQDDEAKFQKWVHDNHIPWRDTPDADYDMRGFWKAMRPDKMAGQVRSKWDGKLHFPDKWKTPFDATFSNQSIYANPDAPRWDGNRLISKNGQLIVDETPKSQTAARRTRPESRGSKPTTGPIREIGTIGGRDTPEATKAKELADAAETAYNEAVERAKKPTSIGDTGIVLNWVKSQIAGAGRMSNVEIEQALKSGSFGTRYSNAYHRAVDGTLDPVFRQQMVDDIKKYADVTAKEAKKFGWKPIQGAAGFDVTDPNGQVHHFDTQEQADRFKKLAGIK